MKLRDGIRPIDVPPGELSTYANEEGLGVLAELTRIISRQTVEIQGQPIEILIAERMGLTEPDSEQAQEQVREFIESLSVLLPAVTRIEYIKPFSSYLEGDDDA